MHTCSKCAAFSSNPYRRDYPPEHFIEGNRESKVWIVGLNPASEPARSSADLVSVFDDPNGMHGYFRGFKNVSQRLFDLLGKPGGVAHTDLIKCTSTSWPPKGVGPVEAHHIVENCRDYLESQLL